MNVQKQIENEIRDANEDIRNRNERFMESMETWNRFRSQLESLPEDITASVWRHRISFASLTREGTLAVIRAFGGHWEKDKTEDWQGEKIRYSQCVDDKFYVEIEGEPPPSCKKIEVEEEVPAQPARKVKKWKIVCNGDVKDAHDPEVPSAPVESASVASPDTVPTDEPESNIMPAPTSEEEVKI